MTIHNPKDGRLISKDWYTEPLAERKLEIKSEIERVKTSKSEEEVLKFILEKVQSLESSSETKDLISRYIFAMSALVYHRRHGGLEPRQINALREMIYAILRTEGIPTGASITAKHYGDLHIVLSQIYRKEGLHWRSVWEHNYCKYVSTVGSGGSGAFQDIAFASRLERLGSCKLSIKTAISAMRVAHTEYERLCCVMQVVRCYRLLKENEKAKQFLLPIMCQPEVDERVMFEAVWLNAVFLAQEKGDIGPIIALVKKGKSHYTAEFVLEAFLWTRVSPGTKWMTDYPKISSLVRRKEIVVNKSDYLYKACLCLEEAYDSEVPIALRIANLGNFLEHRNRFILIEHEILITAAATRFLSRVKSTELASVMYEEYKALSLRLTDGKSGDVFELMQDLADKPWTSLDFEAGLADFKNAS